ncbi:MAG: hypothetical protein ABIJ42_10495 [Acidobacteriota bacterium]
MGNVFLFTVFSAVLQSGIVLPVRITDSADEGMEAFRIETAEAIFYYQKEAGGFSSIMDRDGIDWIGYRDSGKPEYPASAASDYRGMPNLVFRGTDDGAGHPGFRICRSELVAPETVRTVSQSGLWAWEWRFRDSLAEITVLKTDPSRAYWFLYEGIPGGRYSPAEQYWGTDLGGPRSDTPDYLAGEELYGNWKWVYFGDVKSDRVLFILNQNLDTCISEMGYLGADSSGLEAPDGMVVFGFGRNKNATSLLEGKARFTIGFFPSRIENPEDHSAIADYLEGLLESEN